MHRSGERGDRFMGHCIDGGWWPSSRGAGELKIPRRAQLEAFTTRSRIYSILKDRVGWISKD